MIIVKLYGAELTTQLWYSVNHLCVCRNCCRNCFRH